MTVRGDDGKFEIGIWHTTQVLANVKSSYLCTPIRNNEFQVILSKNVIDFVDAKQSHTYGIHIGNASIDVRPVNKVIGIFYNLTIALLAFLKEEFRAFALGNFLHGRIIQVDTIQYQADEPRKQ